VSKHKVAWQAEENEDIQRVTQQAIIHELTQRQSRTIESVVPWFLENMPPSYFRQVPWETRINQIKAISAIKEANMDLHMNLRSHLSDGRLCLTFIRPGPTKPGGLLKLVNELPWNHKTKDYLPLSRVLVYTANDETLSLNMFNYGNEKSPPFKLEAVGSEILKYAERIQKGEFLNAKNHPRPAEYFEREQLLEYMKKCSFTYLSQANPRRFLKQRYMFSEVSGTEGMDVSIEEELYDYDDKDRKRHFWFDIAVANSLPQVTLENASRILYLDKFDVVRAHLDVVSDGANGDVTLLRLCAVPMEGNEPTSHSLDTLAIQLKRTKWLDPATMDLVFDRYPWLGIPKGEIITAFVALTHAIMAKQHPVVYSKANILETVTRKRYIAHIASIAELFLDRFNPKHPLSEEELNIRADRLRENIEGDIEDSIAVEVLHKMIDIVHHTLRTNIYLEDRYALGLRLDPKVMVAKNEPPRELPYGVLFIHGRRFNGFHVRFRDIARGGLRLVTPQTSEQLALESARQYDECYGLAYAQQLKNKDIPEGGAKAVCLIGQSEFTDVGKKFIMRKSVKAFTDAMLDLIVDTPDTRENVVDHLGKKEVLYLGPDEQIIPQDINWIVARAAKRGYDTPAAFMSSKPRAGINHKEYGVTSEGVNVYLDVALRRALGIDPKNQPFTIKMTGGPNGDVAGNEIKILFREYGENAKIVGMADHSGSAEDPDGLDHEELLRLFHSDLSISEFDEEKIGPKGKLYRVDTEEGIKMRNTMHFRVEADAFIPAGGRPNTIDVHNYKSFLKADGTPSSPLIIEGANLFLTKEARENLFNEAGVLIVKDSSANKCGVICSSYEISAAMLLNEEEFFENKEVIVHQVLDKLRSLARMEAELLFREYESYPGSLTSFSQIISNTINMTKDALIKALDTLSDEERDSLLPLFRDHLPAKIADMAFDRVYDRVPLQYIKNAIASSLASKMVYKEGTKFVQSVSDEDIADTALRYLKGEKEIATLRNILSEADMPESEKVMILQLLEAGGARTLLTMKGVHVPPP